MATPSVTKLLLSSGAVLALAFVVTFSAASRNADRLSPPARAAAFTPDAKVITDNIGSGSECNPTNPNSTTSHPCLGVLERQITAFNPSVVTVEEACQSDVAAFQNAYPNWTVVYQPDAESASNQCAHNTDGTSQSHGNFVAAPSLGTSFEENLVNVHGTTRTMYMLCANTGSYWICDVHLPVMDSSTPNVKQDEINEMTNMVESLTGRVIVTGDFNSRPTAADNGSANFQAFQSHNFTETDPQQRLTARTGSSTVDTAKFDYIWYHKPNDASVTNVSASVIATMPNAEGVTFDHDLLEGQVQW